MVDHTPVGAVAMGAVVEVGAYPMVCHKAIAAGVKGALSIFGGVYEIAVAQGATITAGGKVFWDAQGAGISDDASLTPFGSAITGGTGNVFVFHHPSSALAYPTLVSATIPAAGTTLVLVYSEAVTSPSGGEQTGWTLDTSGAAVTATGGSGTGTTTHTLTLSRTVLDAETDGVCSYDAGTGDLVDAGGMNLASITDFPITNNSTQV
jgi:predicted RecA/RadA family phage recombinase